MNFNPKQTLSYFNAVPQVQLFNLREVPVSHFALNCKRLHAESGGDDLVANPDKEALEFYALNHLVAVVRKNFTTHETLPKWALDVMNAYQLVLCKQGNRILNYMLLVTTRESRHAKDKTLPDDTQFKAAFAKKFGGKVVAFAKTINGKGSDTAADIFMTSPPDSTMGNYCDSLPFTFYNASFSGGYGGKPWGMIADTTASFINGLTSMEMLLDTAYTLAHNNGPMFNKGMMYSMYTNDIYKILDVQRSGQIPELVMFGKLKPALTNNVMPLVKAVMAEYPTEFGTEVDWFKVEELGSLHKYPAEKEAMAVKPPPTPPKPVYKDGVKIIGQFKVTPGETVDIYQRNAVPA